MGNRCGAVIISMLMLHALGEKVKEAGAERIGNSLLKVSSIGTQVGCWGFVVLFTIGAFGLIFQFWYDDGGVYDNTPSEWGRWFENTSAYYYRY
ncbi:hypothetical protein [[Bacillus] enclensis]|uniref:hypothetical protein n=1 Tax=[Bacillus] enclensis TaxID=1402860 RepID=UPI0018DCA63F|nr:hypothetical protein [[Bacillus] enclensis]MBH9967923.1 hypothetical protein [[Bacillus] enclensis]